MANSPDSSLSRVSTDNGIAISNQTLDDSDSATTSIIEQVRDLQALKDKLVNQKVMLAQAMQEIQNGNQKFDEVRIRAERSILFALIKEQLLLREFRLKNLRIPLRLYNIGAVTLSNIRIQHSKVSSSSQNYYLCALIAETTIFLSQVCVPDASGLINFNMNHTFIQQPVDFEISLQIYVMTVKRQNFRRKLTSCWCRTTVEEPLEYPRSQFQFQREVKLRMSHVNKTNATGVDLLQTLFFDAAAKVDTSSFRTEGWLDVSKNGLFFDQRWCSLKGTTLRCFYAPNYNSDSNPGLTIDLRSCNRVRETAPLEITRNKVLVLEMDENDRGPFNYYLSTNSLTAFNTWRVLEKLVATLHAWKEANCAIVCGV